MPKYMHDSKSQDDKLWGIGHVLFAITIRRQVMGNRTCSICHYNQETSHGE